MPHIIVEHTEAVSQTINIQDLNKKLHACLADQETVSLQSVKTRAIKVEHPVVGDGSITNFVHITVLLLAGRDEALKQTMAKNIFDEAKKQIGEMECLLSVNVDDLGVYQK